MANSDNNEPEEVVPEGYIKGSDGRLYPVDPEASPTGRKWGGQGPDHRADFSNPTSKSSRYVRDKVRRENERGLKKGHRQRVEFLLERKTVAEVCVENNFNPWLKTIRHYNKLEAWFDRETDPEIKLQISKMMGAHRKSLEDKLLPPKAIAIERSPADDALDPEAAGLLPIIQLPPE